MKQIKTQKWILSTLLFAALGSQYYFSMNSKSIVSLEMASRAPNAVPASTDASSTLDRLGQAAASADPTAAASRDVSRVASADRTEAVNIADCVICHLPAADVEALVRLSRRISADATVVAPTAPPADETPSERSARLREEARDRKEEARQAKIQAEKDKQTDRDDEFKDKVADMADSCADKASDEQLECLTSRFTSLLSRYSGSRKVSPSVVRKAYQENIEKALKAKMGDDTNSEQVAAALEALGTDIPDDYRQLKQNAVDLVKANATARAEVINQGYKTAEQLRQSRPAESSQLWAQAQSDALAFRQTTTTYANGLTAGLAGDSLMSTYMQRNFTPAVANLFTNLANTNGLGGSTATGTSTTDTSNGRNVVRGGNVSLTPQPTGVASPVINSDGLSGVNFGSPVPAGSATTLNNGRNARGAYTN